MSRTPFDVFCKQFLETFLSPIGTVNINREIPGESRWVDVWFEPNIPATIDSTDLGLLGRIAKTPCLIEPFRNQPFVIVKRNCLPFLVNYNAKPIEKNDRFPIRWTGFHGCGFWHRRLRRNY